MKIDHTLSVQRREKTGTRYARREREAGRLPAVLYGHGKEPVSLSLDAHEANKFFRLGEKVFNIELASEGAKQAVLLKEIQFDYLGTNIVHVDLTRVDLDEEIEATVPLETYGEAVGLKGIDGVLQQLLEVLPVKCTVANLPEVIRIDVTNVTLEEPLRAQDIVLPEGVTLNEAPERTIVTIAAVTTGGIEGEAESIGAEGAEPEVITEKKEED